MNIFQPTISGSLFISGAAESGGSGHIVTINTSSGLLSYTSSNAIGGGGVGFPFSGSAIITGSLLVSQSGIIVTGSISSTNGFTGSLFGTSSWAYSASQALTASWAENVNLQGDEGVYRNGNLFRLGDNTAAGAYSLIPFQEDRYLDMGDANNSLFLTKQTSFRFKFSGSGQLVLSEYNTSTKFQGSSGASVGVLHTDNTGRIFVSSSGGGTAFTYNSTSSVIGDGTNTSYDINHGFNTRNLHITVYESGSNGETVYPDIRRINENTASIIFANPPALNEFIVYVSQ